MPKNGCGALPLASGVLLLLCPPCSAEADKWIRVRSDRFEVLTNASAGSGRDILKRLEQIRIVFEARTQQADLTPLPVRVFVFRNETDFLPYQVHQNTAGYYQAGEDRDYIAMAASSPDLHRVVFHEYAHLLMRHAGFNVPVWLNEGTAELYSTTTFAGAEVRIGDLIPVHLATLKQERMLDMPTLLGVDHTSSHYNERGKSGIFYAQSWALAHMLNFSGDYQPGMPNFLKLVLGGETPRRAFEQAFGKTLSAVTSDLVRYIHQDRFVGVRFRAPRTGGMSKPDAERVDGTATDFLLADLLLAIRNDDRAEAVYARLAAENPNLPDVYAALAALSVRRNQDEVARRYYERAIELGSRNGRVHLEYAMVLRELGESDESIVPHLERAASLQADFFEAHHLLGYLTLRLQRYTDSVRHLKIALSLQPRRLAVWEYLALAHHHLGDRENARAAALEARKLASTPEDTARIDATLELIEKGQKPETIVHSIPTDPKITVSPKRLDAEHQQARTQGMLVQVDCLGAKARLHIITPTGKVFIMVRDPSAVSLKNTGTVSTEFACGAGKAREVLIEYRPNTDTSYGTIGDAISIEFR